MAGRVTNPGRPETGRRGYREAAEPEDTRPLIVRDRFWKDETERLTYEHAVEANPRKPGEGPLEYIARLAAYAQSKLHGGEAAASPVREMPAIPEQEDTLAEGEG